MDVIPLKAELVRGSHGRIPEDPADYPIFITEQIKGGPSLPVKASEVYATLLEMVNDSK